MDSMTEDYSSPDDELDAELDDELDDEPERVKLARGLLPGWFLDRMMTDYWHFGLMMSNGTTIGIHSIRRAWQAADGTIWLDVELMTDNPFSMSVLTAPTSRTSASINTKHVLAAFELADT